MPQVAVTMLDVDHAEAGVGRQAGGVHEIANQAFDLVVGEQYLLVWNRKSAIEHRVAINDPRLPGQLHFRTRKPARVRQLQADDQVARVAKRSGMFGDQFGAQRGQVGHGLRIDEQLVRICPAVVAHGHGFAAPDQLGAADPESAPAAPRQLAWPAVERAVPAFHRQDGEAIADAPAVDLQRLGQGRLRRGPERVVAGNRRADRLSMPPQFGRRLETRNAAVSAHLTSRSLAARECSRRNLHGDAADLPSLRRSGVERKLSRAKRTPRG